MAGAQTGETLARQMRKRLAQLVDDFVRQIKELPGYSVFAEPVLQQSARQLYEALIEGLETGDAQPLVAHAAEQATRRRQQGVTQKELDQVAEIFATTTQDFVTQLEIDDVPSAQAAIKPLLESLGSAFKAEQAEAASDAPAPKRRSRRKKSPSPAKKPATRSGGKRMTNRHENEFDHESILEQLQQQARQLETSARVSRQLTAALDLDELLLQVVELIKSTFDYYHVHIYLLDIESGYLIMREGTGEVGQTLKARGHRIESGRGMVGTVAKSGEPLLTPDVSKIENWLPNPLLPETKSELTVPLKIGDRILGVLDVQSNEVGGLTETDLALMESLAQQTAVAVQNAILFRETRAVSIISRAVSSGLGMEEFFSAVSRELRAVLDFDYMTVATYYEIVSQVELVGVEDRTDVDIPLEEGVQLPIDLCIPGMAIQQGRSIIVPNLEAEPFNTLIDAEILVKNGMRSQMSVPLQTRGQIVATINFVSKEELAFTAADAHLMEQISGQLASALENAQIFENIQQMVEERASESVVFRAMVENAFEAIALGNVQQILTYANPAFYALHGYDPETDDLTRRSLTSFIVSEDEGAFSDEVRDHILGGGMWRGEVQHRRKDGTLFQALTTFFAVRDEAGEPMAIAALIRDVTAERKIMAISQVASSTPDLDRLAPLVLEEIAADTDIDRAVLILYDQVTEDGPESMSVIAVYDPETGGERIVDEHLQAQDSPFSTIVYHERSAVWVADVATDERLFEQGRELLLRHDIVAMLALPIMVRDAVVGMVAIDWRKPVDLSYDQISLYQVMVNQVSTAVENARLVAQQQQALEETLDRRVREVATSIEVGQAIATAPELDELFNRVVTLIKERFGYYHAHVYQIDRERNELEMMAGYGEPGRIMRERGHRIPMGKGLTGTAATTGQTVRVDDVSKQEAWLPNPLLPDTKSELAVPIKLGDEVLGVLDVQSDQLAGLSEDDELLLLGLCGQIAVSIQNTQILSNVQNLVEERTRQVAMFQALAENSVDAIGLVDAEGTLTYVNRAFGRVFGFDISLDEIVGQSFYALLEEGEEALARLRQEASTTGRAQLDLRYLRQGGDVFFGETTELPIVSELGEPMATAYLVRDVTDRQRLERITREIARASGLRELASSVLIGLIEGTGIDHAALVLYDEVEDGSPTTGSYVATYDHEADEVAFPGQHFLVAQFPVAERLYAEQQAIRIDSPRDAQLDKSSREFLKRYEYGAGLLLPIISREHAIGFVILAMHETVAFTAAQAQGYQTIVNQVGAAIENANLQAVQQLQLMNTIRRLGQQVTTVTEVAQEISAAPALEETFQRVVTRLQDRFGYFHVRVYRVDPEAQEAFIAEATGQRGARLKKRGFRFEIGDGVIGTAIKTGEPILISDRSTTKTPVSESALRETKCQLAVPIKMSDTIVGVLDLQNDQPGTLTEEDQVLMIGLCGQIAIAIRNAELLEEVQRSQEAAQRRAHQLELSSGVSEQLTANLNLNDLLASVVNLIQGGFDYYHVHVYLVEEGTGDLLMMEGTGEPGMIMKERGHRIPAGKGLVGTAAATGSTVLVPDVSKAKGWLPNPLLPDTKSELSVPFKMGDEVIGVLDVQDDQIGGLAEEDQALLEGLGGQIAVAVQNARVFGEIGRQVTEQTREIQVFQALAENAADAIAMADLDGKLFYANRVWYDLYRYDAAKKEAVGISVDDVWAPETCAWMKEAIGQQSSREWRGQVPQELRDGTRLTIELTAFVVRDQNENPIAVAAMGRDVTAARLSDELTRLVSTASSQSELGVELLRVVLWGMNVDRGSFVIYEGEGAPRQRTVKTVAAYDDREKAVVNVDQSEPFDSDPIHAELCNARQPIIYNDLGALDEERRAPLEEAGVAAIAALPLITEAGQVGGALLLQRKRDMPFGDEIAFLTPILQQVSLAVSNLIFREAQERETSAMLAQRTTEMQLTTEVAQAIASAIELDDLFQRVVTLVKEQFGYYHVHVYQHDPARGILELAAGYGEPGRIMREQGHSIQIGSGLTGTAAATGEPVLASDVKDWETWLSNPLLPDTKSEVAVPIKMGDEVLGVLDVQDDQVGALTLDTQVVLQGLCGQIAIAIQNTRLLQETQASLRRTDLLLSLSTALSSLTEPQTIADALAEQLMNIANIERCSVTLCSEYDDQDVPRTAQVYALNDRDPRGRDAAIGHSYALTAFPTFARVIVGERQVLATPDLTTDESLSDGERTYLQQGGAVSSIVVPMVSGERVVGYFTLQDREPYTFTESEIELYRGIASQSATAFSNALSLTEVQETLDEVNMLYESSRAISTANTREDLTETVVQRIVSTNVDHCEILLYEQRDLGPRYVEVVGSWSLDGEAPAPDTRYRLKEYALTEVAEQLADKGTRVISADDIGQSDQVRQMCVSRGIKALALVPLNVGQEYLGFLVIERHKSSVFAPDTLRFYETVASQSAVALRNIQLIEQTQQQLEQLQKSYDDAARLADTVRELSSPVIQVWEDVLVLPLVGAIDSRRALNMMEALLTGITEYQAEQVIIDITGVPVMDTSVANYLLQTIKAASLLGARCMLVGISSEMAQTIVGLGLDLSSITTYSNLRAGIQAALQSTGSTIVPLPPEEVEEVL